MNLMDPANPMMSGVVQNQDSYMKGKIAQRWYYDQVEPALPEAFDEFYRKTGRRYDFVDAYRCEDAEYILVGMGCYMETAQTTVDYLREEKGIQAGCLNVYCFRPFPAHAHRRRAEARQGVHGHRADGRSALDDRQPSDARNQGRVLRRDHRPERPGTDRPRAADLSRRGGPGQPRRPAGRHHRHLREHDRRRPGLLHRRHQASRRRCTVQEDPDLRPPGAFSMRGHSVGGFGSVTTNKVIATIGGQVFGKDVQAYPKYGSEKKGLPTTYYLTIADSHIFSHSELEYVDLVVLNDTNALFSGNPLDGMVDGGAIFMQSTLHEPGRRLAADPGRATRTRSATSSSASTSSTWCRSPATWLPRPTCRCGCRASCCWAAFLKLTPYAKTSNMTRRCGLRRRREGTAQVLRQARRAGRAGQPQLREARLQRDAGDSAGDHSRRKWQGLSEILTGSQDRQD